MLAAGVSFASARSVPSQDRDDRRLPHSPCGRRARAARLHPRDRPRRHRRGADHGARHALPARAERLPPHRAREVDRPQLRHRQRVRRHLQPPVRRHEPGQGGAGVHRRDHGRRPLARVRLGRQPVPRQRLLRAAVRLGGPPRPDRQGVRGRPDRGRDPRDARHADQPRDELAVPRPERRGEPRPVRAHARGRVPQRRPGAPREGRHGQPEHQPARPRPLPDRPRDPPADRRRLVDLPDLRHGARAVGRDRGRDALDLHPRVRGPPAALRLARRQPAGAARPPPVRVRAAQPHLHRAVEAVPAQARPGRVRARLGRPADADDQRPAPARLPGRGDPQLRDRGRRGEGGCDARRRAARARGPGRAEPDVVAAVRRARPDQGGDRELPRGRSSRRWRS